jgi:hypothetical protein
VPTARTQPFESPDVKIQGIVTEIQYNYEGDLQIGTYELTALISVLINETILKPETFTRERNQLIGISYNYSIPPVCKANDFVEVYGLWVPALDVPASLTVRVDDHVTGSYVDVMPSVPSSQPSSEGNDHEVASIDTQSEYSNGSIQFGKFALKSWYDWINIQGTQVIFFAYYSEVYNSPIITFVGQHYVTMNGTEVFIGNTLTLMEVYNDANKNNVPEVNEIGYFFLVNSSVGFAVTPIQKITLGEVAHYRWGVKYQTVDGFLLDENGTSGARVIVEHMAFSYDYYIQNNVSYLKTGFDIGEIVKIEPNEPDLTLEGLSLSLLYATMTITTEKYTVLVNEQPYNSANAFPSPLATDRSEINIANQKTYEFVFGENYTLYRNAIVKNHKSFSAASATNTVSSNARGHLNWLIEDLERVLEELFPRISEMQANIDLDYATSTFVYRVCYPTWGGHRVKHDPIYIAYINPQGTTGIPISIPLELLITATAIGLIALIAAVWELQKTKRLLRTPLASS